MKKFTLLIMVCVGLLALAFSSVQGKQQHACCKNMAQNECRLSAPASELHDVKNEMLMKF